MKTKSTQCGVAAVEFALICVIFFTLILGIMDFGRLLFTWNSATEATRRGVRLAVVCDKNTAVEAYMAKILPSGMNKFLITRTTEGVTVEIKDNDPSNPVFSPISPWLGFTTITMPTFSTYLPVEGKDLANPDCS
jgi:Flp pilus assembly protein TadG